MARWFTADWHLGEERLLLMGRPFATSKGMFEALVRNHNDLVGCGDEVFHLGDVCYFKRPEHLAGVAAFNGRKTLIRGNHDRLIPDEEFLRYFDRVIAEGEGLELNIGGLPCWATHYPTRGRADRFNLVGHIHGSWRVQLNMLNCGVDANHFRPISEERVAFMFRSICEVYDQDVWVSDHPSNLIYKGTRGRPSTYLEELKRVQS